MPLRPQLRVYQPLGGSARQYVHRTTGKIISRRQFQKLSHGGLTPEKVAQRSRDRLALGKIRITIDRNTGRQYRKDALGRRILVDPLRRYRSLVADFREAKPGEKVRGPKALAWRKLLGALRSKDNSPTGAKARALASIGRRDPASADWVGETANDGVDDRDPGDYLEEVA